MRRPRRVFATVVSVGVAMFAPLAVSCSTTASISDIYMALDSAGNRKRSTFFTDSKEIHCIAEGGFGRKDVTVEGYMRQVRAYNLEDDSFDPVDTYYGYVEFAPEPNNGGRPQLLDISLIPTNEKGEPDDKAPFAAGSYVCEITLDGQIARSIDFNIDFAECPPTQITRNAPCIGFYRKGVSCNQFGVKSSEDSQCKCTTDKGWDCQK